MRLLIRTLIAPVLIVTAAFSVPQPPPPPDRWKAMVDILAALPSRFPAADISRLEALVAEDVKVYRDGVLVHDNRQSWIRELQAYRQRRSTDPIGFTVSRDHYNLVADGGVSVREFTHPFWPEGRHIVSDPTDPLRYVTYYVESRRLVRVVYGPAMSSNRALCQAVTQARADWESGGKADLRVCE